MENKYYIEENTVNYYNGCNCMNDCNCPSANELLTAQEIAEEIERLYPFEFDCDIAKWVEDSVGYSWANIFNKNTPYREWEDESSLQTYCKNLEDNNE